MSNRPILVMGICGVGKSTIAQAIAASLGGTFIEADSFHSPEAVAWMAAGKPLTDDMRWGWLDRLGDAVNRVQGNQTQGSQTQGRAVLACSALGRAHRDRLRARTGALDIVFLNGDRDLIAARMNARKDHYMPASLIDSQLATLQPPDAQAENALWISVDMPPDHIIQTAMSRLALTEDSSTGGKTT